MGINHQNFDLIHQTSWMLPNLRKISQFVMVSTRIRKRAFAASQKNRPPPSQVEGIEASIKMENNDRHEFVSESLANSIIGLATMLQQQQGWFIEELCIENKNSQERMKVPKEKKRSMKPYEGDGRNDFIQHAIIYKDFGCSSSQTTPKAFGNGVVIWIYWS